MRHYARWLSRAMCQALERQDIEGSWTPRALTRFQNSIFNQIGHCEHFFVRV
jgi:hypothetical protein